MPHARLMSRPLRLAVALAAASLATTAIANEAAALASQNPDVLSQVLVVGQRDAAYRIPGSAHVVGTAEIRDLAYDDVGRALRRVPGVYIREEDGYGLFPNISLRGVDTSRSAKVPLMEDGILAAPAPYAAPSAYYSPTTGRMAGIEVLKGSSQIKVRPAHHGRCDQLPLHAHPRTDHDLPARPVRRRQRIPHPCFPWRHFRVHAGPRRLPRRVLHPRHRGLQDD